MESQEVHNRLCECSEEIIQNLKEKANVGINQEKALGSGYFMALTTTIYSMSISGHETGKITVLI